MGQETPGDAVVERLIAWAADPHRGGRLFRWGTDGAGDRFRCWVAGRVPLVAVDQLLARVVERHLFAVERAARAAPVAGDVPAEDAIAAA